MVALLGTIRQPDWDMLPAMNARKVLTLVAFGALLATGIYLMMSAEQSVPPDGQAGRIDAVGETAFKPGRPVHLGVEPVGFLTNKKSDRPHHKKSNLPWGTRHTIKNLPAVNNGIPLPDGSFIPFLNGMTHAPPLHRDPRHGPVPPVVAKVVDDEGFEWWEHADHSVTTSRYKGVEVGGESYWDPGTDHLVPTKFLQSAAPGSAGQQKGQGTGKGR